MTDTSTIDSRAEVVALMRKAADEGNAEKAEQYRAMLATIDRQARTTGKTDGGLIHG